jgi:hypothetical protein
MMLSPSSLWLWSSKSQQQQRRGGEHPASNSSKNQNDTKAQKEYRSLEIATDSREWLLIKRNKKISLIVEAVQYYEKIIMLLF